MPKVKNTAMRYRIINECIRNPYKPYPNIERLREVCEEKLFGSIDGSNLSRSAIEKDLNNMKLEYDAPIKYSKSHGGYYYENPDFSIDSIPLKNEEAQSLRFAALTLSQYSHLAVFKNFQGAIKKVLEGTFISEDLEDESVQDYVQFEWQPEVKGSDWLNPLFVAIKAQRRIKIAYFSLSSGKMKVYDIEPYLLKEYRHHWYLIAFRVNDGIFSTFQLGRIESVEMQESYFERSADFSAESFFKYAFGITVVQGTPEVVKLEFLKRELPYIQEHPLHQSQKILEIKEESFVVTLQLFVTHELIMHLLSFGASCKVLEPIALRDKLKEEFRKGGK